MEHIILLATFIVAFLMSFFSYRQGIKDGKSIANGENLKPLQQPKPKLTAEEKELQKQANEFAKKSQERMTSLLNYAGRRKT